MGSTFLVNVPDIYLLHLHVAVYSLFHRLYGMYPCHFLTYLRKIYTKEDNQQVFKESILVQISWYDVISTTKTPLNVFVYILADAGSGSHASAARYCKQRQGDLSWEVKPVKQLRFTVIVTVFWPADGECSTFKTSSSIAQWCRLI